MLWGNPRTEYALMPFPKTLLAYGGFPGMTAAELGTFAFFAWLQSTHGTLALDAFDVSRNSSNALYDSLDRDTFEKYFPVTENQQGRRNPDIDEVMAKRRKRREAFRTRVSANGLKPTTRFLVLERDGFRCRYCGLTADSVHLEIDHAISRYDRGADHIDNLVTACALCNRGKGRRSVPVNG